MMIGKMIRFGRRQLHTIISREIIKPSSPTPFHLQTYNVSQLDQLYTHHYIPLIFYYPNNETCSLTPDDKAREMKKALSQSLARYYPLAGRLYQPTTPSIDCNDEGVVFVEAKNDSQLNTAQDISDDDNIAAQLFVDGMFWKKPANKGTGLLGVQLNHFACGGMAVAVSMSHRVGDGCTLGTFVNHWASVARYGSTDHQEVLPLNPHFMQFPATSNFLPPESLVFSLTCVKPVTRKFVFPNSKLSDLKNKVLGINNPTRVEVLTSLIYKTVVAATTPISSASKPSYLVFPLNLRNKFVPKLPETTVGNFIGGMLVKTQHESETSLSVLVSELRKQKMEVAQLQSVQEACQKIDSLLATLGKEDLENVVKRSFCCSSICGFPLNKVDFGWGNPAVASLTFRSADSYGAILKDTPNGDGIEAWVTLETEDMERFQNDKELLSFC